jgi:hypothetical protein
MSIEQTRMQGDSMAVVPGFDLHMMQRPTDCKLSQPRRIVPVSQRGYAAAVFPQDRPDR